MIEKIKKEIKEAIEQKFEIDSIVIEEPKKGVADIAIPLFAFAKLWKTSPMQVYDQFSKIVMEHQQVDKIEFMNGFLNIYLERQKLSEAILKEILEKKEHYGYQDVGHGEPVVMDYSSPNIAKSFGIGHLRSTMIGNALNHIYTKCGYHTVSVNHLGDWGTQFGKMIVAYQKWGNEEAVRKNSIAELQKLYVRFHDEEHQDPSLEKQARHVFSRLESNDETYFELWKWFKEESLREFMEMYDLLGVTFDSYDGESFYNDKMDAVVEELEQKGLLRVDEGATIVDLGQDLPPALIKKSDGATLYITRDIAAIFYRQRTYKANKFLYIVGNEQQLHFKQLKAVTDLMGYHFDIVHANFGLVMIDGKKMSTRGGKFKRLEDVIKKAIDESKKAITEKNPDLKNQDKVAKAVGVGAIIYNDLKNEKHLNVDFNLENMLKFEGQTGPYLQYSSVRIESILKENTLDLSNIDTTFYQEDHYFEIIKQLSQFPHVILKSMEENAPNLIARYIMGLAQGFNSFYGKQRINVENEQHKNANLYFIQMIQIVINEGLRLLGIEPLKEM
ncbi:arginine--tRNA ligase [Peloplasma aerotolerans]|uniref:Arginine--tRNA ligase n=1 Tax=Peloplasma aerotolerans TaxID=3044389 RepID=A0AAW6U7E7_9MOLU|nr:arginine--tRNA ligase [Mariniplasma sp. M4Ah]MDI6452519.1 arginine--tRNA ligase [Mariniplasma sp. M4Ah]